MSLTYPFEQVPHTLLCVPLGYTYTGADTGVLQGAHEMVKTTDKVLNYGQKDR